MKLLLPILALTGVIPAMSLHIPNSERQKKAASTPRLVQYVQTFHDENNQPLSLLPLLNEKTGVTHVILASLHLNDGPGNIDLNDNPPNSSVFDQVWSDVKTLQQNGIKVMALLGGAAQGSYQKLSGSDADFDSYYTPLLNDVIKQYSLDGLDLDIEETVDVSVPLRLLNRLYSDLGSSFLLTMAPVASALASRTGGDLSGFSYFDLDSQATVSGSSTKLVSWYNAQFYSGFGSPSSTGTYQSIIGQGWAPSRVVMGVLDSSGDGSGFVALNTLKSTIQQLRAMYSTFGGVDAWEYWDAGSSDGLSNPYQWVQAIGQALTGALPSSVLLKARDAKKTVVTLEELPVPETPFPTQMVQSLQGEMGAGWYQAVRALNVTAGDLGAARELLRI